MLPVFTSTILITAKQNYTWREEVERRTSCAKARKDSVRSYHVYDSKYSEYHEYYVFRLI